MTKGGLTLMCAPMPVKTSRYALVHVAVSNGSEVTWQVNATDFAFEFDRGVLVRAESEESVIGDFFREAGRSELSKLQSAYEKALYNNQYIRPNNGYEKRRQSALAIGPRGLKAASAAAALTFVSGKLSPGDSTDGALFFPTSGRQLNTGRIVAIRSLVPILASLLLAVPGAAQPNVVLILADDMSWVGTSVLMDPDRPDSRSDYHSTPSLERLASEGMRFTDAYAPHPNCSPTRLAIQTGKSPAQLKMTDIINRNTGAFYEGHPMVPPQHINHIPHEEVTVAELLEALVLRGIAEEVRARGGRERVVRLTGSAGMRVGSVRRQSDGYGRVGSARRSAPPGRARSALCRSTARSQTPLEAPGFAQHECFHRPIAETVRQREEPRARGELARPGPRRMPWGARASSYCH